MGIVSKKMDLSEDMKKLETDNGALRVLESMSNIITPKGEISSKDNVQSLIKIMGNANKLVKRCMCLNILHVTNDLDYLNMFISTGGWDVLYDWLKNAQSNLSSDIDDYSMIIIEILRVYERLPVCIDDLKRNGCAKTIKSLSKVKNEGVQKLAFKILSEWMLKVKNRDNVIDKSHKKHKKERRSSKEYESHRENINTYKSEEDNHLSSSINNNSEFTSKVSRPKTAKMLQTKFRSTGLLEEIDLCHHKKRDDSLKRNINEHLKAAKRVKPSENHDSIVKHFLPENPKALKMIPIPEIYESSGFMDAISVQKRQSVLNHIGSGIGVKRSRTKKTSLVQNKKVSPASSPCHNSPSETLDTHHDVEENKSPDIINSPVHEDDYNPDDNKAEDNKPNDIENIKKESDGKKRRNVSWANENVLKTFHYFDLDENERVNVNRISFEEIRKQEKQMEKQHMNDKKPNTNYNNWILKELDLGENEFVRGSQSFEKDIQSERENQVLKVLYFSKNMIPESACEPDHCPTQEYTSPKIIPYKNEEIEEQEKKVVIEKKIDVKQVVNNFNLTPQMASLLKNITNGNQTPIQNVGVHKALHSNMMNGNMVAPPPTSGSFMPSMNVRMYDISRMQHNPTINQNRPNSNMMHRNTQFRGPRMNNRNNIRHHQHVRSNVCRNYLSQNGCRFGNNCNFFHPQQ